MLGLLLIYFLGRAFYNLAIDHDKHKWGFAIAGVVSYYVGTFIGGLIIGIGLELYSSGSIETINDFVLGLMALPFGLLSCGLFYYILKRNWENNKVGDASLIDEIGQE